MKINVTFLFIALLLCPLIIMGQEKKTYVFAERDSSLMIDVWQPVNPRDDHACVMAMFGGGFVAGSRDNELQTTIARLLTARGFVVVSPDYRLGLKDSAQVAKYANAKGVMKLFQWTIDIASEDCAAACAWVVAHANEINVDPEKIILTGSSAGAITVLQMDYYRANSQPQVSSLPDGWKPAAVVAYSGAVMSHGKPKYAKAPAPTMMLHGTKDKIVAYKRFPSFTGHALRGANNLKKVFERSGFPCWVIRFKGIGHEVASFLPGSVDFFCGYVEQVLNGRVTSIDAVMNDTMLQPTEWTSMTVFDLYKH